MKIYVFPGTYASETLTMAGKERQHAKTSEIKFLNICVVIVKEIRITMKISGKIWIYSPPVLRYTIKNGSGKKISTEQIFKVVVYNPVGRNVSVPPVLTMTT